MLPLVEIPPTVKKYAEGYQDLFSPEQFEHFKRYLTGLSVSENKTIQAINGSFVVKVRDQSSLNRFFTQYNWSATAVNGATGSDWRGVGEFAGRCAFAAGIVRCGFKPCR